MPVYLVRHACAGDKRHWPGDGMNRPLDEAGVGQADALAGELTAAPIHRILTSPARRCHQTVEPLAHRLDLPVEVLDELSPDGESDNLAGLLTALDASTGVICTHGELMRPLLAELRRAGTRIIAKRDDDDWLLGKGTAWELTLDPTGTVAVLHHRVPPSRPDCPTHDRPEP